MNFNFVDHKYKLCAWIIIYIWTQCVPALKRIVSSNYSTIGWKIERPQNTMNKLFSIENLADIFRMPFVKLQNIIYYCRPSRNNKRSGKFDRREGMLNFLIIPNVKRFSVFKKDVEPKVCVWSKLKAWVLEHFLCLC